MSPITIKKVLLVWKDTLQLFQRFLSSATWGLVHFFFWWQASHCLQALWHLLALVASPCKQNSSCGELIPDAEAVPPFEPVLSPDSASSTVCWSVNPHWSSSSTQSPIFISSASMSPPSRPSLSFASNITVSSALAPVSALVAETGRALGCWIWWRIATCT